MKNLTICPLNFENDINIINNWEKQFNKEKFESIKHFILEDSIYYGLDEVIINNYEFFSVGDDEKKYCLTIKDGDTIAGFILACLFNMSVRNPELIIQYIVLNPNYQNMGYGTQVLTELLNNGEKYFCCKPNQVYANIEKENVASLNLFKKMGFTFETNTTNYFRAQKHMPTLEEEKI